ncbi:hypothetical protein [Calderihabitans maritimus]|uniref:Uncharacterized protein n=1 Tax=Calderihabitans maritimus TaxID=1246530 RepID=A0A1Z5HV61_9FIRM|nr:hypothetical protein [Calderihabitans maritimus]GAW93416.1 hypothetical protein KKC1_25500 [Calderihabitans maritimus]
MKVRLLIIIASVLVIFSAAFVSIQELSPVTEIQIITGSSYLESYDSLAKLTDRADAIVIGTFKDVITEGIIDRTNIPYTDFSFKVEKVIKGSIEDNSNIVIHQLAGNINGQVVQDRDDPLFKIGEKALLFLGYGTKYFVLNGAQGRFPIINGKVSSMNYVSPKVQLVGVDLPPTELQVFVKQIQAHLK